MKLPPPPLPSCLGPSGVYRLDRNAPDGIFLVPWRQVLVWDATCLYTFAPSHLPSTAMNPGVVAMQAEQAKRAKYTHLDTGHYYYLVAVETSGVLGPKALPFHQEHGHCLREAT